MRSLGINVANNIKRLRFELGWTQAELGEKLGMHQTSVAKIESGVGFPLRETLAKLAEVFNVEMEDLINIHNSSKGATQSQVPDQGDALAMEKKRGDDLLEKIGVLKYQISILENENAELKLKIQKLELEYVPTKNKKA